MFLGGRVENDIFLVQKNQRVTKHMSMVSSFSTLLSPAGIEDKENIVERGGEFELLDGGAEK